ncbi:ATP-binding protein [Thermomonospora umbrina]|uniref:AAA ATPase-like protein n=1 Tax=Thermomonospora umbrina TaxID=111806 RepID=A0A3D9SXZ1_9ACTN|nr:AAA family ATPase [Thermomonospora umbrina]REE97865.1 AAA ATPase-like protein [Thermomonospora umbrina]
MTPSLIGRDGLLDVLRTRVGRACAGHGGLVLVTGEAGVGKTSLLRCGADEAREQGMLVLHGSCWDSDAAPGYWPWTQVLRGLRRVSVGRDWEKAAGVPDLLGEGTLRADVDRFELFDTVATTLIGVSQSRPVMVVLDDLHWADAASLALLEFTAQHIWFERLLVVGAYRDVEVQRPDHPLGPLLGPLTAKATMLFLTGLAVDEVGELVRRTAGDRPDPALVEEVHRRTGGNPFFVEETARLWSTGHPVTTIASGVRATVHRRLSLLAEPVRDLLEAAAVLGREFRPELPAAGSGLPSGHVRALLEEAVRARLVTSTDDGLLRFAHDLVRESLYDALDPARRRRLHAAAVRAARGTMSTWRPHPTDLARHAYFAGEELDRDEAVRILVDAARHAGGRLANEEAAGHYRRALEVLGDDASHQRVLLTVDLGLELQLFGEFERSWQVFQDAADQARALGDPVLMGRVALTLYGMGCLGDETRLKARSMYDAYDALLARPLDAPPLGALPPAEMVGRVARRIVDDARDTGDDDALHIGLWARLQAIWGPDTVAERIAVARELIEVSRRRSDRAMEQLAASMCWVALLEADDPHYTEPYEAVVTAARVAAGTPRLALTAIIDQSVVLAFRGRFAEAEELIEEMLALPSPGATYHVHFACHHRWAIRLMQGRFADIERLRPALREQGYPRIDLLEAVTALERGERPPGPVAHPGQGTSGDASLELSITPLWLRYLAQDAAAARDDERCERARTALAPYRGQWMVSLYGWDIGGPMTLWAGLLDAAQGRWDDAVAELTRAQRSADRLHALPWSLRARVELASVLLARGAPDDAETAVRLLREAEPQARRLGMGHLADRARDLAPADAPAPRRPVEPPAHEFTRTGAVWRLRFDGRTVHVPDAKGLRDLHHLLGRPGTHVPAVRLLNPDGGATAVAAASLGGDPVLDDEGKARYRRRLERLDEEIDRMTSLGDDRRAAECDRERAALLEELRCAIGLTGRNRRLGDETERARKNVTARIRDALRKLDDRHPELAAHLRASVSTGVTCCYAPDGEIRWRL